MKNNAKKIYELLKQIPKGKVTTYKELADKIGTKGYRMVGKLVGLNPNAPKVPCHRVVKTDGGVSGYAFGINKKIALLKSEGVLVKDNKIVDFQKKLFKF